MEIEYIRIKRFNQEIEKVYEAYMEARDHIEFSRRVKDFSAMSWVAKKIRKHGFRTSFHKAAQRIRRE